MEEAFSKILDQFKEFFSSLSFGRKVGLLLLSVLIVTGLASMLIWAGKTRYKTFYSDLNKEDAVVISRILKENGISYQLSSDGKTIQIPEDQIDIWRLEIAKRGVQFTGTVGYEIFDKQNFGTTSFVQRVNRQRALEGELVKTIKHIKGVKRARVHLSIPENSPFVSDQKPPSASVVLEVNHGVVMTPSEIRGVASLVSSSVEGMRPEAVVIVDARGKKLSENIGDEMTAETANRLALESRMNRLYEDKIEDILGKVVGDGKVIAKVKVTLDYTQSVSTETFYDEENKAVLSEVKNKQILNGSRPSPQGIPGARSNLPGQTPQPGIPETTNNVDKDLITKNYNVPSKVTKSRKPTATVKAISAAVMVDGKRITLTGDAGKALLDELGIPKTKYEPWSDQDITSFTEIVKSSIGLSDARGDKLVIKKYGVCLKRISLNSRGDIKTKRKHEKLIKNLTKVSHDSWTPNVSIDVLHSLLDHLFNG